MKTKLLIYCSLLALSGSASAFELSSDQSSLLTPDKEILPDENGVTVTYTFKGALSTEDNLYPGTYNLSIPGFGNNTCSGQAAWPVRWDSFVIPDGCEASVQLVSVTTESRNMRIAPSRLPLIDSSDEVYSTDNVMPVEPFPGIMPTANISADGTGNYRDRNILYVKVAPVTYSYESGTTYFAKTLSYRVTFSQSRKAMAKEGEQTTRHTVDEEMMHRMFTYYKSESGADSGLSKSVSVSSATPMPAPYYLILSVPKYKTAVDRLASWKKVMGFNVKTIYQDNWTMETIKFTVANQYNTLDNMEYLLIVGDGMDLPGDTAVYKQEWNKPYTPSVDNRIVHRYYTDYVYSLMDGYEDRIPDIYIGRLPVETLQQANIVVDKIINYESNPPTLSSFYTSAAHCAEFSDTNNNKEEDRRFTRTCEDIRNGLVDEGISIERIYYYNQGDNPLPNIKPLYWNNGDYGDEDGIYDEIPDDLKWPGFAWNGNGNDISTAINSGVFYLLHRGHGGIDKWVYPSFNDLDIASLSNGNLLPVVFSINCQTGMYHDPEHPETPVTCFAEEFLRKQNGGCVGIFAASQVSLSGVNDVLAMEMFSQIWPDQNIKIGFKKYRPTSPKGTGESVTRLGQILHFGKENCVQYMDSEFVDHTRKVFHCFGDPSMRMYTKKPVPTPYSSSLKAGLAPSVSKINITCPMFVTLSKICLDGHVETAAGSAFDIPLTDDIEAIYVHASNYIPQEVYHGDFSSYPGILGNSYITDVAQTGGTLAVSYEINEEDASNVKIQLSSIDECGNGLYSCDATEKRLDVDVSGKKRGFYVVSLIVNGKNVDNKKLMIK